METWTTRHVWAEDGARIGETIAVGEENGLGQRRARLALKPGHGIGGKDSDAFARAIRWANEPRPIPSGPPKLTRVA